MTGATDQTRTRTAVVTGATGGMGRAIAKRLAQAGFDVAVAHSAAGTSKAENLIGELRDTGRRALAVAADVSDEPAVNDLFEAVESGLGQPDVVVHTAAINRAAPLVDLDLADFDEIQRVNVRGTFVVDQQAARRLRAGGAIVNVASTTIRLAPPALSAYTASKAAVAALTRILAKELRDRDITVNAVAPGPTRTGAFLAATGEDERRQLADLSPLGRLGTPEDIAEVVCFLAGPSGRWINGQVLHANGGVI
ncbi:SDR family oxidoreductase [Actinoplanes sp. NPDC049596]|uniref:SDR family oxidoreductase n=1 Tax=unclassified Actinoplanes TaxID=2626549 RepID=UPI0034324D29